MTPGAAEGEEDGAGDVDGEERREGDGTVTREPKFGAAVGTRGEGRKGSRRQISLSAPCPDYVGGGSTDRPHPPWEEHGRTLHTTATPTSTGEWVRGGHWLAGGGRKEGGGVVAEAIAGARTLLGGAAAQSEPTRPALLRGRSREGGGACPGRVLRGRQCGRLGPPHRHEGNPPTPLRLPPTRSRLGCRLLPRRRPCPSVWRQLRRRGGGGARAAGRGGPPAWGRWSARRGDGEGGAASGESEVVAGVRSTVVDEWRGDRWGVKK
jgi:hypothetical protein